MPASIEWHTATIRFGPKHRSWRTQDPWTGAVQLIADLYEPELVHLFCISGRVGIRDHRDILRLCADLGYTRMQETHAGQHLETDLLARPFRRRVI